MPTQQLYKTSRTDYVNAESTSMIRDKICEKCGSNMAFRYHVNNFKRTLILQCTVCRHYIVVDES